MVRRPVSIPETRRAMREGLQSLADRGTPTECTDRPVPYTEVAQSPEDAAELCGRGTDAPCPLLDLCGQFAFTEGVYADGMVYGGYYWKRGLPVVSRNAARVLTR